MHITLHGKDVTTERVEVEHVHIGNQLDMCYACYSKRATWTERLTGYIHNARCGVCNKLRSVAVVAIGVKQHG